MGEPSLWCLSCSGKIGPVVADQRCATSCTLVCLHDLLHSDHFCLADLPLVLPELRGSAPEHWRLPTCIGSGPGAGDKAQSLSAAERQRLQQKASRPSSLNQPEKYPKLRRKRRSKAQKMLQRRGAHCPDQTRQMSSKSLSPPARRKKNLLEDPDHYPGQSGVRVEEGGAERSPGRQETLRGVERGGSVPREGSEEQEGL